MQSRVMLVMEVPAFYCNWGGGGEKYRFALLVTARAQTQSANSFPEREGIRINNLAYDKR
jgi:hypothetical protein